MPEAQETDLTELQDELTAPNSTETEDQSQSTEGDFDGTVKQESESAKQLHEMRELIFSQQRDIRRYEQENTQLREPKKEEEKRGSLLLDEDPDSRIEKLIAKQLAPVLEMRREFVFDSTYAQSIAAFHGSPLAEMVEHYGPLIKQHIRAANYDPTPANIQQSVIMIHGSASAGLIQNTKAYTPKSETSVKERNMTESPSMRATPKAAPKTTTKAADEATEIRKGLTERDRQMMRTMNITEDDFVEAMGLGDDVASWVKKGKK